MCKLKTSQPSSLSVALAIITSPDSNAAAVPGRVALSEACRLHNNQICDRSPPQLSVCSTNPVCVYTVQCGNNRGWRWQSMSLHAACSMVTTCRQFVWRDLSQHNHARMDSTYSNPSQACSQQCLTFKKSTRAHPMVGLHQYCGDMGLPYCRGVFS